MIKIELSLNYLRKSMFHWLKQLFSPRTPFDSERVLALESEQQKLALELRESQQKIATLKEQLERQKNNQERLIKNALDAEREIFFTDTASAVTQLLTQAYLVEEEGKPVQSKDILTVAKRLIATLKDSGLTILGKVGERVTFDPNYHQPLRSNVTINASQGVVIKIVGVSFQGKVIRKAMVQVS
ncbi:MAG: nucleotide exchange factor GrpE [Crocinitomicaceae bacterium]|nr:nucleotide exchange factor GrpE [Crocinitomicaceae bacterium]